MSRKLRQSEFVRSVTVLVTGTVMAQLIAYLITPLITRWCSEADIGELNVYTRIVLFVTALATARYELSLPVARQELDAYMLYRLSFRIAVVVLLAATALGAGYLLFTTFEGYDFALLAMIIVSTYAMVWINLGTNWSIRKKEFGKISRQRVINAVVGNGLKGLFAIFGWGGFGLIVATFLGSLASSLVFVADFLKIRKFYDGYSNRRRKRMVALSKEYKRYPIVGMPHVLLDVGVDLMIAAFIKEYFGIDQFGLYSHAYAMLKVPLAVVGTSIGQVFFNKCSEMVNNGQSIRPLLLRTFRTLLIFSIVPFTVLFFFGGPIFGFVFGEKWTPSGEMAEIMAPWLMLNFILSPVSSIGLVLGRQRELFLVGVFVAVVQLVIFGALPYLLAPKFGEFDHILIYASYLQAIVLALVVFLYLRFARLGKVGT